ncbi:hypothetical protein ACFQJ7_03285 [Halovenus rubra]|uniref:Uncharacterized protein n=2 Tax=Halovenus rubra TaxID=869890 RepID=A0ACC7E3I5_9EURY|nr:hypothetical protein [Halovenus rubra]
MTEQQPANEPTDRPDGRPLEVYEWGGALVAGLGFLFTPLVTGLPALYCTLKLQKEKPLAAIGIGSTLLATILFWGAFRFGSEATQLVTTGEIETQAVGGIVFSGLVIVPLVVMNVIILVRNWR